MKEVTVRVVKTKEGIRAEYFKEGALRAKTFEKFSEAARLGEQIFRELAEAFEEQEQEKK